MLRDVAAKLMSDDRTNCAGKLCWDRCADLLIPGSTHSMTSAMEQFTYSWKQLRRSASYFCMWFAVEAIAAAACAALHRRHLFVWVSSDSGV